MRTIIFIIAILLLPLATNSQHTNPESRFAKLDNVRVHYQNYGSGKEALVFVHGWTCNLNFWKANIPAFVNQTRVIAIDLPGHGESDKPQTTYSMDFFARAVDAVLQDAKVERAVLVGHSMGTPVVRQFYRKYPKKTRALVLVDGGLRPFANREAMEKFIEPLRGPNYKEAANGMLNMMLPAVKDANVREEIRSAMLSAPQHVMAGAMEGIADPEIWKTQDKINVPVLAIYAKHPFWTNEYEQFVRGIVPDLDYQMWEGVSHFLMMDDPQKFNDAVLAFLKKNKLINDKPDRVSGISGQALSPATSAQKTTAQQLGYGPNDKVLMVHADDLGMSHSVNVATIDALKKGMVTSGSIMVPCPWFPEIAAYAREHPELDLGLHLTLTSEWKFLRWRPVASPEKVKGLLDEEGYMWRSERQTAMKATSQEVEIELRAQIERARQFGIKPTHLDTHMGTLYTRKDFFDVYTKIGKEYGIPVMVMRPTPEILAYGKQTGSPITEDVLKKVESDGFVMLDHLATGVPGKNFAERKESYKKFLRSLKPGVTMLIVHLGMNDPELKATTGSWEERYGDFLSFTDPEIAALIKELGIKLTTWREMGKIARKKEN